MTLAFRSCHDWDWDWDWDWGWGWGWIRLAATITRPFQMQKVAQSHRLAPHARQAPPKARLLNKAA